MTADTPETTITLTRVIDASAEEIFAAWTDPALLEQWLADEVDFEPFEGGGFRLATADADDPEILHVVTGTVTGFEEDRKLVEIWHREGTETSEDSTLILTFLPLEGERTEVTLVEIAEAHADSESRIFSMEAWNAALTELAELLE